MAHHRIVVLVPQMGGWRAHVPDFPGCRAEAMDLEAAIGQARRNVGDALDDLRRQGQSLPVARSYEQVQADVDWARRRGIHISSAVISWIKLSD
jgi:predicted RNase H-like HicB family nuclease